MAEDTQNEDTKEEGQDAVAPPQEGGDAPANAPAGNPAEGGDAPAEGGDAPSEGGSESGAPASPAPAPAPEQGSQGSPWIGGH